MNITVDMLKANPTFSWDWGYLSSNISLENIFNNRQFPWDGKLISQRQDITIDIITNNYDFNWDWRNLSSVLPLESFKTNTPHLPWDWKIIDLRLAVHNEKENKKYYKLLILVLSIIVCITIYLILF